MSSSTVPSELSGKTVSHEAFASRVASHPALLSEVFAGLGADEARVKYGCLKVLRLISEREPAVVYPWFGRLAALLESENTVLKWGAIIIFGNLAAVDTQGKLDKILTRYLRPISGPVLITAANTIGGAGKIAAAKPRLADRIARALMRVEDATYQTAECRNVALGRVVASLELFFDQVKDRQSVLEFVRRQLNNTRPAVRRKAARFLEQHGQKLPQRTAARSSRR